MPTTFLLLNEFETALKLFIQALGTFAKVGSPYANQAAQNIALVRKKIPEERFVEIVGEYGLEAKKEQQKPATQKGKREHLSVSLFVDKNVPNTYNI